MALFDDLIAQVPTPALRAELARELAALRRQTQFGLVFEEHRPEFVTLRGAPVRPGARVRLNSDDAKTYKVLDVRDGMATIAAEANGGSSGTAPVADLLVVKDYGEPVYPTLTPLGAVQRGGGKAHHAVINGENLQALELLGYLYEERVDCIYIDPPYNTGARDWKYNNAFVDANDRYRHSKWLAFLRRRLRLARRLLKPNGVLIVTIDANEVHHLGMLLEDLFPDARRQMITICINPSGVSATNEFSRVEEYAFFCFFGDATPVPTEDAAPEDATHRPNDDTAVQWDRLMRRGSTWYREARPNLCYPILLDPTTHQIVGTGPRFEGKDESQRPAVMDGNLCAWPVRKDGKLGIWRVGAETLGELATRGYVYVTNPEGKRGTWTIQYLMEGTVERIKAGEIEVVGQGTRGQPLLRAKTARRSVPQTVWRRGRHAAGGAGGTQLLNAFLGERNRFPFPKSVYAVRDCIEVAVGNRPDALIVDFFAGSGTTLHATCLMNAADGGHRRCVLVTNNEVDEATAAQLRLAGVYPGTPAFERHGIFERATRPRCEAAVRGTDANDQPVEGQYPDGRPYSEGFEENVEFFRLDYLDPDDVILDRRFDELLPLLWLAAGGRGKRPKREAEAPWLLPVHAPFAILLDEAHFHRFRAALHQRSDVTHVWLVTDSPDAFAWMQARLPTGLQVRMLYDHYLRNFHTDRRERNS